MKRYGSYANRKRWAEAAALFIQVVNGDRM
jgi:hypothetical protein